MIEIANRQKIRKLNLNRLSRDISRLLKLLGIPHKSVSFFFCDNKAITTLNKKIFHKDSPTDVISFNLSDSLNPGYLGEVIISVEEAVINCRRYATRWQEELFLYVIHGLLHILGYKDSTRAQKQKMQRKEEALFRYFYPGRA